MDLSDFEHYQGDLIEEEKDSNLSVSEKEKSSNNTSVSKIPADSEFANLKFSLPYNISKRTQCSKCGKCYLMYCPFCMLSLPLVNTPIVHLPISLDIVHHPKENKQKSTAVHACVLSQDSRFYEFPIFPEYNPSETLVLFPSPDAKSLSEIDLSCFRKVVFIDSTWQQTFAIRTHPIILSLTKIKLNNHKTLFWRYQNKSPEYLATIEAIYFFFKEYYTVLNKGSYTGECDDLLFFYAYQYEFIQKSFKEGKILPSKRWSDGYLRANRKSGKGRGKGKEKKRKIKEKTKEREDEGGKEGEGKDDGRDDDDEEGEEEEEEEEVEEEEKKKERGLEGERVLKGEGKGKGGVVDVKEKEDEGKEKESK